MDFIFKDYKEKIAEISEQEFITIFQRYGTMQDGEDVLVMPALIDNDDHICEKYAAVDDWGIHPTDFGHTTFSSDYNENIEYVSGTSADVQTADRSMVTLEYLVAWRHSEDEYPDELDIRPELLWYHDLYHAPDGSYREKDSDGLYSKKDSDDTVISVVNTETDKSISVRTDYIRDYLAAINRRLVLLYDVRRFGEVTDAPVITGDVALLDEWRDTDMHCTINGSEYPDMDLGRNRFSSMLNGKVFIRPYDRPCHPDYTDLIDR